MIQYVDLQHCRFTLETGNDFSSAENIGGEAQMRIAPCTLGASTIFKSASFPI